MRCLFIHHENVEHKKKTSTELRFDKFKISNDPSINVRHIEMFNER